MSPAILSVVTQIDGPIITFRDGRNQATSSLDFGNAATFRSETYARFEVTAAPGSQRERSIKNMVQFGEESASRLESSRIRVRGLSEFLYLYKKVENSRKPKLQATSRRFLCPAYRARASLSSRFCSVHYVLDDGWNSGANTHTGYLYRDDFLVACVAATQRTDKSELLTRTK